MPTRFLTALPVYNEVNHAGEVLDRVLARSPEAVVVTSEHDILDGATLSLA